MWVRVRVHPSSQMVGQLGFLQAGVRGLSVSTKNEGRLGTATAGVEGTVDSATGFGVYGRQLAGGYAIRGENTDSGNYGELGGFIIGIKGYSVSGAGVSGSTGVIEATALKV